MSQKMQTNTGMQFTVDPNDAYVGVPVIGIIESMGLLPYFAADVHLSKPESMEEACEMLMECYRMGLGEFGDDWGKVTKSGTYVSAHEEDPEMEPLAVFELTPTIRFFVYQSAIVGVYDTEDKTSKMTRMD